MAIFTYTTKRIYYDYKPGKKPSFVFLHGLGSNHTACQPLRNIFSLRDHATLIYDLPGHGFSDPLPPDYTTQSSLLKALLNHLKIRSPVLIGYSYGAAIAAATTQKVRCKHLFLLTPFTKETIRIKWLWKLLFFWGNHLNLPNNGRNKNVDYSTFGKLPSLFHPLLDLKHVTLAQYGQAMLTCLTTPIPTPSIPPHIISGNYDFLSRTPQDENATIKKFKGGHLLVHKNTRQVTNYLIKQTLER